MHISNMSTFLEPESLATYVIKEFISHRTVPSVDPSRIPQKWHGNGACFVTVYINKELRGCIGSPVAYQPLYKDIVSNAVNAVSEDYRFPAIRPEELPDMTVEVSLLTPPVPYKPESQTALLAYLLKEKPGLIIEKGYQKALFLPQVWKELTEPEAFLSHLCLKAGLDPEAWKITGLKYKTFRLSN